MQIKLLYFGRPAESLKISEESIDTPATIATLRELLAWLRTRGDTWDMELAENRVRCAINQEFATWSAQLNADDEVAVFSPISGG